VPPRRRREPKKHKGGTTNFYGKKNGGAPEASRKPPSKNLIEITQKQKGALVGGPQRRPSLGEGGGPWLQEVVGDGGASEKKGKTWVRRLPPYKTTAPRRGESCPEPGGERGSSPNLKSKATHQKRSWGEKEEKAKTLRRNSNNQSSRDQAGARSGTVKGASLLW